MIHKTFFLSLLLILISVTLVIPHDTKQAVMTTESTDIFDKTIDRPIQKKINFLLRKGVADTKASSGIALLLDIKTGTIVATAQSSRTKLRIDDVFLPYEPGSVMKPLLVAAALDSKSIKTDYKFYNTDSLRVQEKTIVNVQKSPDGFRSLQDILSFSLNTGAVSILNEMGKGKISNTAIKKWHYYLTKRFYLDQSLLSEGTSVYKGYIPTLSVPQNKSRFAQTTYGAGLTVSPINLAAAYAAILGDGRYCVPKVKDQAPRCHIAVKKETAMQMRSLLQNVVVRNNPDILGHDFSVAAKSGTMYIAQPGGNYSRSNEQGTYIGSIHTRYRSLVLLVRLNEPHPENEYASKTTSRVWNDIAINLFDKK